MTKITDNHRTLMKLIERSPDIGDGWRQVSDPLWHHVVEQAHPNLTELDVGNKRIRFTEEGLVVMKYAI